MASAAPAPCGPCADCGAYIPRAAGADTAMCPHCAERYVPAPTAEAPAPAEHRESAPRAAAQLALARLERDRSAAQARLAAATEALDTRAAAAANMSVALTFVAASVVAAMGASMGGAAKPGQAGYSVGLGILVLGLAGLPSARPLSRAMRRLVEWKSTEALAALSAKRDVARLEKELRDARDALGAR